MFLRTVWLISSVFNLKLTLLGKDTNEKSLNINDSLIKNVLIARSDDFH